MRLASVKLVVVFASQRATRRGSSKQQITRTSRIKLISIHLVLSLLYVMADSSYQYLPVESSSWLSPSFLIESAVRVTVYTRCTLSLSNSSFLSFSHPCVSCLTDL